MCYSATSSIGTFLFVSSICIVLWIKGDPIHKALAFILLFISLMQVVEFFLWYNLECSPVNKFISNFIPVLLFFQPLVVLGSILYFNVGLLSQIVYKSMAILWLFCIPFFINWMKRGVDQCTNVGPKGHLMWPYANTTDPSHEAMQFLYNATLGISVATLNTKWFGIFYTLFASLSYTYTRELYGHSWGSVWCNF
jgi:hypothetical protein